MEHDDGCERFRVVDSLARDTGGRIKLSHGEHLALVSSEVPIWVGCNCQERSMDGGRRELTDHELRGRTLDFVLRARKAAEEMGEAMRRVAGATDRGSLAAKRLDNSSGEVIRVDFRMRRRLD